VVTVELRKTRLDPLSVWIRTGTTIVDDEQRVVAERFNQIMVHRAAGDVARG